MIATLYQSVQKSWSLVHQAHSRNKSWWMTKFPNTLDSSTQLYFVCVTLAGEGNILNELEVFSKGKTIWKEVQWAQKITHKIWRFINILIDVIFNCDNFKDIANFKVTSRWLYTSYSILLQIVLCVKIYLSIEQIYKYSTNSAWRTKSEQQIVEIVHKKMPVTMNS